jgi:hypothetical protein
MISFVSGVSAVFATLLHDGVMTPADGNPLFSLNH